MKKPTPKASLLAALTLILFAGSAPAQKKSPQPKEPNKADSNEMELTKQKRHLESQKRLIIRRWRQLKPGMTEKQVQRTLGRPKLIQGASHECIWCYQDLPVSNAEPNFSFRGGGAKQQVDTRYGAVVEKIGVSDVGGVKNGLILFEAKSIDSIVEEKIGSVGKAIAKAKPTRDRAIARAKATRDRNLDILKEMKRRGQIGSTFYDAQKQTIKARFDSAEQKAKDDCDRKIDMLKRKLDLDPRSPVFALKFFNQPDWNRFEDLLPAKQQAKTYANTEIDKWKVPLRWRKLLKINMTPKQVYGVLGEPHTSKTTVEATREQYGHVSGHGQLYFTVRSDSEERLDSWIEPFWPAVEKSLHGQLADVPSVRYSVLREYKPYKENTDRGLGLDILLESDLNREQIISFLKNLSKGKDPVTISIYTDQTVYENANKDIYGPEYGKHFLLVYIKNTTVKRAFYGIDEIRWMQETGKFSHLFGKKTPMPTIENENAALRKHNIAQNGAIGISYDEVMEYLSNFFSMEKATLVHGQERYMGQTSDSLAVLEIIGNKDNISQATLMIGVPSDAPRILVRNTAMLLRFLENTVPEWTNSSEWATAAMKRVTNIPGVSDVKVVKGNKLITMTFLKPVGMLSLTVKHK